MTAKDWRYVLGKVKMLPKICHLSFSSLIGQFWRFIPPLRSCAAPTENKRKITFQLYRSCSADAALVAKVSSRMSSRRIAILT